MSTTTTSSLFGVTRNPWDRSKSAGGSSGGSAAAVAAGVVPAAHGSDTGGSIRAPAGRCGVFGLKPSRGRVGQPGRIPHPLTVEHALTRSVRDSAALLDAATRSPAGLQQESESFLEAIKRPPRPLRIGLQVTAANRALVDETCRLAAHEAAALCESLGHHVTAFEMKLDLSRAGALYSVLCSAGTLRALDARAAQIGRDWDGSDVEPISYQILDAARKDTARDYDAALDEANALSAVFAEQTAEFDVILSPTTATFTEPAEQASLDRSDVDGVMHAMAETAAFLQIFNVSGRPAMSVPVVWIDDLPVGVQFGAGFGQEALLLQLAAQLEQARPWFSRYARCLPSDG